MKNIKEKIIVIIGLIFIGIFFISFIQRSLFYKDNGNRERNIIIDLLNKGYHFILPKEYFAGVRYNKMAIIIHDADFSNSGFSTFIKIESEFGIKSAFYPRLDTDWFSQEIQNYKIAENNGWEIGFQYDCLSRANNNYTLALQIFKAQLSYMRMLFNITTTDYHGDSYNFNINNLNLYNQTIWESLGLHEVYKIDTFSYYSDTNNNLVTPKSLGDLVIIQLHTDWTD